VTIHPGCLNTTFTLYDADMNILPPHYNLPAGFVIPNDVDAISDGDSRTVECDITDMYAPETLFCSPDEIGTSKILYLQATYGNDIVDPNFDPATLTCRDGEDCFDLFNGAVSSNLVPVTIVCPLEIGVDIQPGKVISGLNLGQNGNVPLAVLSSPGFDATDPYTGVDIGTLVLEGATGKVWGEPILDRWSVKDVDGDGLNDLMLHFEIIAYSETPAEKAVLRGKTLDGKYIQGYDYVKIVN
jgi:hypothetical protein